MPAISYDDAAHVLRRVALGGSTNQINQLRKPRARAVDSLVNFQGVDNSALESRLAKGLTPKKFSPNDDLQLWWAIRLVLTARPFEEKLTLFWHNHFATSLVKVP